MECIQLISEASRPTKRGVWWGAPPPLEKTCHFRYVLYLMECFKYAFNILTVSDGMF